MMQLEWAGFFILTLLDALTAITIFFCALNERMLLLPFWYRIGLILTALGFAAQVLLNSPYLLFGTILLANQLPFWILKDVGTGIVATHYAWQIIKERKAAAAPVEKRTVAKRKPALRKAVTAKNVKKPVNRQPAKK